MSGRSDKLSGPPDACYLLEMFVCPECGGTEPSGGFCTRDGTQLADAGEDALLGTRIGAYQIARLIGVGGMGRVYKGVNPQIGSRVAIKVLSRHCADKPDLVERFFSEAKAVNLIRHENIVNVLDLDRLGDGRPYIVMEFLDGSPLSSLIAARGPLPLGSLARLMGEVLSALGSAHEKGVIHRDLKPDNVFVTPHGRAKVLDFGIAKLQLEHSGRSAPTRDGSLMGTPHYMAPEQAQAQPVTPRADIYAAGVILFEGACGRPPFAADSLYDLLRKQVEEPPPPPSSLRPDMPPAYERVITRALAKDPQRRHESARALYQALVAATRELPETAWAPLGEAEGQLTVGMGGVPTPAGPTPAHMQGGYRSQTPPESQPAYVPAATPMGAGAGAGVGAGAGMGAGAGAGAFPGPPTPQPSGQVFASTAPPKSRGPLIAVGLVVLAAAGITAAALLGGVESDETAATETAANTSSADAGATTAPTADASAVATGDNVAIGDNVVVAGKSVDRSAPTTPPANTNPAEDPGGDRAAARPSKPPPRGSQSVTGADAFDVAGFTPRALALAREAFPDAVLARIDASGVRPDGRADLTLDPSFSVLYRFVSPSRAKRPADLPLGVEHKPTCLYYVNVTGKGIDFYPLIGWKCDMPPLGRPRCSTRQVWKRAAAKGAPTRNAVATLGYWASPAKKRRWHFEIKGVHSGWIPDDC